MNRAVRVIATAVAIGFAGPVLAGEQAAIDGCIDQLRTVGGPDGQTGEVVSSEFSQAGTFVTLRDGGGTVWECIGYSDGTVGELRVAEAADDGGGAMAGSADDGGGAMAGAPTNEEVRVQFAPGTTGATYSDALGSGDAVRYLLGARDGQVLTLDLRGNSQSLNYIIYVPDGDILFESSQGGYKYEGQLYEDGDHVVEVFYNGNAGTTGAYDLVFQIK